MSGITTIIVREGQYKCEECLKMSLKDLSLENALNHRKVDQTEYFELFLKTQANDSHQSQVRASLQAKLKKHHELLLPKYTEFHAVHEFKNKGFKLNKTLQIKNGYKYIFEKVTGKSFNKQIEKYIIKVFPGEGRILIEGENMAGKRCRQYARRFEKDMGKVESYIPSQIGMRRKTEQKLKARNKVQLKYKPKNR